MSPAVLGCSCGCESQWRRAPRFAPRLVDDPACLRHVRDFGELYRRKADRQRAAEGRQVAAA